MLIGLDFDNTIAGYDEAFVAVAHEWGLVPDGFRGSKKQVRDAIRLLPEGELKWQKLQGRMYGYYMPRARLMEGVVDLMRRARREGADLCVVSHKTEFGHFDSDRIDLRRAALEWMAAQGLFAPGLLERERVYFEPTREQKVARIAALGCTHFIDDLEEVFTDSGFPRSVQAYLYAAGHEAMPVGPFTASSDFTALGDTIFGPDPAVIAERLLGGPIGRLIGNPGGGNNRLYRVECERGSFALKCYPTLADDPRDRLGVEFGALTLLRRLGETAVPDAIAAERAANMALYDWIEGTRPTRPDLADIKAVLAFTARLRGYGADQEARRLAPASEACLSGAEVMVQVRRRLGRLEQVARGNPALAAFLVEFIDRAARLEERAREGYRRLGLDFEVDSPADRQCLSPSDFGFHNALRRPDGSLIFLDLEYFGWDDPVKLAADFVLHPGMALDEGLRRYFTEGVRDLFCDIPGFAERLGLLTPLFGLRWGLIILNEFLPERWVRRSFAGAGDRAAAESRQLAKAQALLSSLDGNADHDR